MTVLRLITVGALTAALVFSVGCQSAPTPPSTKLTVQTVVNVTENCTECGGPLYLQDPFPGIGVWGNYAGPNVNPYDQVQSYWGTTSPANSNDSNSPTIYQAQNLELPANWDHWVQEPSMCSSISGSAAITQTIPVPGGTQFEMGNSPTANNAVILWGCNEPLGGIIAAAPSFAMAGSIPASITVPGQAPFSTSYGMPTLYLYSGVNGTPSLAATVTASSVNSGGSSATFPLTASLASNSYGLVTANATSSGSYLPNGVNFFAVGSSQTIAGNPFGVAAGGLTTSRMTCTTIIVGGHPHPQCSTLPGYLPVPVVSLYSQAQVMIGNTPVTVGNNPTAVAVYPAATESNTSTMTSGNTTTTTTTSASMRAVVANSGSNTITILDILNDDPIFTVTVGNQPVALVVSSDGSTGYVANYADGTVTEVNLTTYTPVTTVPVGGQPTSIALTATGTLWVGGVGFLTEINTQNMSVVATESTGGKTIVALGYSDQVGQIVAVSVDSSGNVYDDQLNPANVTARGTYTPLNSVVVSTLGTHLDTSTDEEVRSFTDILASTPTLSVNQPGGPPLVVYDAWVAVTATPSGFTITDIADNYVFASVPTPSPVTAIAVDHSLNVAYLTMPDSNLVWTVPLPGTGSN